MFINPYAFEHLKLTEGYRTAEWLEAVYRKSYAGTPVVFDDDERRMLERAAMLCRHYEEHVDRTSAAAEGGRP